MVKCTHMRVSVHMPMWLCVHVYVRVCRHPTFWQLVHNEIAGLCHQMGQICFSQPLFGKQKTSDSASQGGVGFLWDSNSSYWLWCTALSHQEFLVTFDFSPSLHKLACEHITPQLGCTKLRSCPPHLHHAAKALCGDGTKHMLIAEAPVSTGTSCPGISERCPKS